MYRKVFIDANILIDINDKNRKFSNKSLSILDYLITNNIDIFTSCDLITTIYYILSKKDTKNALIGIEKINKICKIIEFSNKEVSETCALMNKDSDYTDLEDTMQYILAKKLKCDVIISNDERFISKEIELINSEEFYSRYI